jgi:hypothetical protein
MIYFALELGWVDVVHKRFGGAVLDGAKLR